MSFTVKTCTREEYSFGAICPIDIATEYFKEQYKNTPGLMSVMHSSNGIEIFILQGTEDNFPNEFLTHPVNKNLYIPRKATAKPL